MSFLKESRQHHPTIDEMILELRQMIKARDKAMTAYFDQQTMTEEALDGLAGLSPPHQLWHTRPPDQQPVAAPQRGWSLPPSVTKAPLGINPHALPRLRLEPPRFDGEKALDWICKVQEYYNHHYTPLDDRLYLTKYLFDPPATDWFHNYQKTDIDGSWEDFLVAVYHRFTPELLEGDSHMVDDVHHSDPIVDAPKEVMLDSSITDAAPTFCSVDDVSCDTISEAYDVGVETTHFAPELEDEVSHVVDDDQLVDQPPTMKSTNNIISNGIGFDTINCYENSETITEEVFASAFFEEAGSCVFDQVNLGIPYIVENSKTATSEPVYVGAYCILDSSIVLDEKMARQNMEEYRKHAYASSIPPNLEDLMVYKTMEAGCNKRFHESDYGKDDAAAALGKQHFELLCITLDDTRERSDGVEGHNISYNLTEAFAADTHSFLSCDDTLHLGRNITIGLKVPPDRTTCSSRAANASAVDSLLSRVSTAVTNKQSLLRVTSAAVAAPNTRKSSESAVNSLGYARKSRLGHEVSLSCSGRDPRAFWRHSDIYVTWPMSSTLSTASTRWGRALLQFGEKKGVCVFDPGDFASTSTLRRSHSCSYWSDSCGFIRKLVALKGVDALVREVASTKDGPENVVDDYPETIVDGYFVDATIVKQFGWKEILMGYNNSNYGRASMPFLRVNLLTSKALVSRQSVVSFTMDQHSLPHSKLLTLHPRVFVDHIPPELGAHFSTVAREVGLTDMGCAWLIAVWLSGFRISKDSMFMEALEGVLDVLACIPLFEGLVDFRSLPYSSTRSNVWKRRDESFVSPLPIHLGSRLTHCCRIFLTSALRARRFSSVGELIGTQRPHDATRTGPWNKKCTGSKLARYKGYISI